MMMTVLGPTVAHPISAIGGSAVTGTNASLSVLGSDAAGASKLVYDWSITSEPGRRSGNLQRQRHQRGRRTPSLTFTKAGTYGVSVKIVDAAGLSVTTSLTRQRDAHAHEHQDQHAQRHHA